MSAAVQAQTAAPQTVAAAPVVSARSQQTGSCLEASGVSDRWAERWPHSDTQKLSLQRSIRNDDPETRNSGAVPAIVHEVLSSPGQPLAAETRAFMEPRFGHKFGHNFGNLKVQQSPPPQPQGKLTVSEPGDVHEQEADEVAEQVTRSIAPPLNPNTPRYDFSQVRIHTGERAAASAQAVNALAYTVGNHIVFGAGTHEAQTSAGKRLLAHELTHVVQQNQPGTFVSRLQRLALHDCGASATQITARAAAAKTRLDTARTALAVRPLTVEARSVLLIAFRDGSDATATNVQGHLDSISAGWDALDLTCERRGTSGYPPCVDMSGTIAGGYTEDRSPNAVHLCEVEWQGLANNDLKENVLVHEASHHFGRRGVEAYYAPTCADNAAVNGLDPAARLQNADSFACFVWMMNQTPEWIRTRMGQASGSQVTLSQTPEGPVDYLSPQHVPMFRIGGQVPEGAQFIWSVRDEARRQYTMWCGTASRSASDPSDCRAAYIHASTRSVLRAREVRAGWVVVNVRLPTGQVLGTIERRFVFQFTSTRSEEGTPPAEGSDSGAAPSEGTAESPSPVAPATGETAEAM